MNTPRSLIERSNIDHTKPVASTVSQVKSSSLQELDLDLDLATALDEFFYETPPISRKDVDQSSPPLLSCKRRAGRLVSSLPKLEFDNNAANITNMSTQSRREDTFNRSNTNKRRRQFALSVRLIHSNNTHF